jgi:copper chaperone CopZ
MKIMIEGMSCQHCVAHVKEALAAIEGINKINEVNLAGKYAIVEGKAEEATIRAVIDDAGYDVTAIEE